MSDYLSRILIGALSIGVIAAIFFAASQFTSLNDAQVALDNAESEMTEIVETANAVQTSQAEDLAEQENAMSDMQATSEQFAADVAATNTQSAEMMSEANAAGTESRDALNVANEAATTEAERLEDVNATSTQIAEEMVNIQQTSEANEEALAPFQTQASDLANIATEQSERIADAQATREELESSLTERANFIATQSVELDAAQEALNVIATSVASIGEIEMDAPEEMTEEAEATVEAEETDSAPMEMTEEAEATVEAEETESAPMEMTEEAEATIEAEETESAPMEMTEEAEATIEAEETESVPMEMTEEAEATVEAEETESAPMEMTEEAEATVEAEETDSAPMEMTEEAEATEESDEDTSENDAQAQVVPDDLLLFDGEGYQMFVPADFLSFDAQRDRTDAIATFRERGSAYAQALTTAMNTPPSSVFLGFADEPNDDGSIDQIIIISQETDSFTTMEAQLELLSPNSRTRIIEREVIEIDGQEVGRVRTEQLGAEDVITHVILYIYYDDANSEVYVLALSSLGEGIEARLEQYEAIGQSFELIEE